MTSEFDNGVNPRPVEQLQDALVHQRSILEFPSDGYYALSNMIHDKIMGASAGMTPELHDDIAHHVALRDMLRERVLGPRAAEDERAREWDQASPYDVALVTHETSVAALQARASQLSPADVLGYFMGKLESHTAFLATGQQPTDWPEAATAHGGLLGYDTTHAVRTTAELVRLGVDALSPELGDGAVDVALRHRAWLGQTCNLLLSRRLVGLATPLINTAMWEDDSAVLVRELSDAMASVRMVEDEGEYRRLYGFIVQTLQEPLRDRFVVSSERVSAPLTPGAKREVVNYGSIRAMVERFEENDPAQARLADGSPITLPYTHFALRTLYDYDTMSERESRETQTAVDYAELDDAARIAVEEAWRVADLDRLREETMPHYKRLVFKPGEPSGNTLHTLGFKDGYGRRIHRYPDDHGFVTSDTEPQIDGEVVSAEPVMDAYLVVPNRGDYMSMTTYRDAEPNFFGPGEDRANAFWIAGDPRLVIDKSGNPKYMQEGVRTGVNDEARWIIMPVRYYRAQERRQSPDYEDELRFFGRQS